MKTSVFNKLVIASDSATFGSKSRGNLPYTATELNQGDCFIEESNTLNSIINAPRNDSPNFFAKLLLIGLMTLLITPFSLAQDFDADRMDRDLRIMENVLGEMFKTQMISQNRTSNVDPVETVFFNRTTSDNVKGTYIPDFGVIFTIQASRYRHIVLAKNDSEREVAFRYSSGENGENQAITEENIVSRISDFLQDYSSTIGQLKDNEKVMVVYEPRTNTSNAITVFYRQNDREETEKADPIPVISVTADKKDLDQFRRGVISRDELQNRISISSSSEKEKLDLKVMKNILSTALGEGDGNNFHLINDRSISYLQLDSFGVLYNLDLHRGHALQSSAFGKITFGKSNNDEAEKVISSIEKEREKTEQTIKEEYQRLKEQVKEYMVDYGRTLNSLSENQFLMISANITDSQNLIPSRITFQLKKSTIQEFDAGEISRDEALSSVTITEY